MVALSAHARLICDAEADVAGRLAAYLDAVDHIGPRRQLGQRLEDHLAALDAEAVVAAPLGRAELHLIRQRADHLDVAFRLGAGSHLLRQGFPHGRPGRVSRCLTEVLRTRWRGSENDRSRITPVRTRLSNRCHSALGFTQGVAVKDHPN